MSDAERVSPHSGKVVPSEYADGSVSHLFSIVRGRREAVVSWGGRLGTTMVNFFESTAAFEAEVKAGDFKRAWELSDEVGARFYGTRYGAVAAARAFLDGRSPGITRKSPKGPRRRRQ